MEITINTTFFLSPGSEKRFLDWAREVTLRPGNRASLHKIIGDSTEGVRYALTTKFHSPGEAKKWLDSDEPEMKKSLSAHFGDSVLSLTTMMKKVEAQ